MSTLWIITGYAGSGKSYLLSQKKEAGYLTREDGWDNPLDTSFLDEVGEVSSWRHRMFPVCGSDPNGL
jgi:hypothetical protein